jgi:hypothetical protein
MRAPRSIHVPCHGGRSLCRTALLGSILGSLLVSANVWADLPSPRLDQLSTVGLAAGQSIELTIQGQDLHGVDQLRCDYPGLTAEFVKAENPTRVQFKLTAAADCPPGTADVYAVGRFGITNPRLLHVVHGLTDVAEIEPNNQPMQAQAVAVNSAISGQADGNNQDQYRFALAAGQRIVIDCWSARLETEMDPILILYGPDQQQVATSSDAIGRDPLIDFQAVTPGDYRVEVRDLTYRGGPAYRLYIHDRPRVDHVFPRAVTAGQTVELTAFGRNLGAGATESPLTWQDLPFQQLKVSYTAPADVLSQGLFRFRDHPMQHSVLPTAATATMHGEQVSVAGADGVPILITGHPTGLEQEPNADRASAQPISLPITLSGRFDQPRDADWFVFETGETEQSFSFEVFAERIAGRCDPYLSLFDQDGNRFFDLDDYGHRLNAFDAHVRDPYGSITLPAKKKVSVLVQDRYQRGGSRFQYVLSIRPNQPDFYAGCISTRPDQPAGLNLWQGSAAAVDVIFHHVDGANQWRYTITADGLPPGVHLQPTEIYRDVRATLVFNADENAPPFTGPIRLIATARKTDSNDPVMVHEVRPHTKSYGGVGCRPMRSLMLAVRERGPYRLELVPDRITIPAGQSADVVLKATRWWPGGTAAINYQPQTGRAFCSLATAASPRVPLKPSSRFRFKPVHRPVSTP